MKEYCKILVIDDEFIMRQGMKHLLDWEKEGFQIIGEASNGQEGLEMIAELHPHIILADIVMPVLDGMELSKLVQKKYPEIQIIILSSFDNFEYVKSTLLNGAVDYILKPTLNPTELLKVLKKVASRIPGMVLTSGNEMNYEKLMERYLIGFDANLDIRFFEPYFKESCFRLFGANLKQLFGGDKALQEKIEERIKDFFRENENKFICLKPTINKEYFLYIINYKLSKDGLLVNQLEDFIMEIARMQDKTHFVLGQAFSNMSDIKEKYENEFLLVAESVFYYKNKAFIQCEMEKKVPQKLDKFDYVLYSSYLNNKQFFEAIEQLNAYIEKAVAAKLEVYKLKNLTKNLIYNIVIPLESLYSMVDSLRQEYFLKIDDTLYVTEFITVFDDFIKSLSNLIQEKYHSQNDRIQEILAYISKHSSESLDLTEVANVFNFNYYYLSSYFNLHIQEGFSDYLNKIRVEKACIILKQTTHSIAEISEMVGYSDQSYFCRVFKKLTRDTPSSYRRRVKSPGESV